MERNILVQEVYETLCTKFLHNVPEEKRKDFEEAYLNFLHNQYDKYFNEAQEEDLNVIACFCVRTEKTLRKDMSFNDKYALLFPDEDFKEFERLCLEISGMVKKKLNDNTFKPELSKEKYVEKLNSLVSGVSELFMFTAKKLLSEALVDLETLFSDSQIRAFRNSHYD